MEKKLTELFDKILEATPYCLYDRYCTCEGCPYEDKAMDDECGAAIKADIQTVRAAIGGGKE